MITEFKIYETLYRPPKVGDHIIGMCHYGPIDEIERSGKITYINSEGGVKFTGYDGEKYGINIKKIQYWSENKEEIEIFLQANKYNL